MTNREIFEKVAAHLLAQGVKSQAMVGTPFSEDKALGCAYRGENGTKCAVGCLIADEHYKSSMEGVAVRSRDISVVVARSIGKDPEAFFGSNGHAMLCQLQSIHDNQEVVDWANSLNDLRVDLEARGVFNG